MLLITNILHHLVLHSVPPPVGGQRGWVTSLGDQLLISRGSYHQGRVSTEHHRSLELRPGKMGAAGGDGRSWLGSSVSHTTWGWGTLTLLCPCSAKGAGANPAEPKLL